MADRLVEETIDPKQYLIICLESWIILKHRSGNPFIYSYYINEERTRGKSDNILHEKGSRVSVLTILSDIYLRPYLPWLVVNSMNTQISY